MHVSNSPNAKILRWLCIYSLETLPRDVEFLSSSIIGSQVLYYITNASQPLGKWDPAVVEKYAV